MELNGSIALVTGGAVRIGRAIVEELASEGARVIIHYRSSKNEAAALEQAIRNRGGSAWSVRADLDDSADCASLIPRAAELAGAPVQILVNNAARFDKDTLTAITPEGLQREFQTNLFAPLILMREFARQEIVGSVINLLDRRIAGLDPRAAAYCLTKSALWEATRLAALTWAPRIRVNAVAPGPALPPPGAGRKERVRDLAGYVPLGRDCPPAEIAEAVIFLLRAPGITGQCLFVDGGQHLLGDPQGYVTDSGRTE
ncbi:MAG: SDR family oxidoreductase, partial [Kiritimatiellae bacterium]|nr:SDR family oxidoreductase [Kiritimatiellia bacterium]